MCSVLMEGANPLLGFLGFRVSGLEGIFLLTLVLTAVAP